MAELDDVIATVVAHHAGVLARLSEAHFCLAIETGVPEHCPFGGVGCHTPVKPQETR